METIVELTDYVSKKAKDYLSENGIAVDSFPVTIADFVVEYTINGCHFPKHFSEKDIVYDLEKGKNSLAAACIDIYAKIGAEGQTAHGENGVSRSYDNAWITFNLLAHFPNYVSVL